MLEVSAVSAFYGKHRALDSVSLNVSRGEVVVILGANGAGKTTLLKVIGGLLPAAAGARIAMGGRDLAGMPTHQIVEVGIALVPEGRGIFSELTVRENLLLGAFPARARANEAATLEMVLGLFPRLKERLRQAVHTMSGGEQQMVAVARGLMAEPEVLILDELSLGLSPLLSLTLFESLTRLKKTGLTMLLVEQNVTMALAVSDYAYVLAEGRVHLEGEARALAKNDEIRRTYLGI
jgi:ABC-type branched-subunit amino acid transport system ATPase component